jgi:hypothetical protein
MRNSYGINEHGVADKNGKSGCKTGNENFVVVLGRDGGSQIEI